LAAIVAADVVGYSRLMGVDEEGTLNSTGSRSPQRTDRSENDRASRSPLHDHGRRALDRILQRRRRGGMCRSDPARTGDRNAGAMPEKRTELRIDINISDVIIEDGDAFWTWRERRGTPGDVGSPGGICVSRSVRDYIRDRLPSALEDLRATDPKKPRHCETGSSRVDCYSPD